MNAPKEIDPEKVFRGNSDSYMLIYKKVVQNDSEQTNEFVETEEFQEANEFEETEAFQEENEFAESAEFVKDSVPTPEAASTDWRSFGRMLNLKETQ